MVRIVNHCYSNLNYKSVAEEILGDDITNEITIGMSPTTLLSTVDLNRRIVKLYVVQLSSPLAGIWVQHSTNITESDASFLLPTKNMYITTSQASHPLSVVCSEGTALLKLTVVNKA